MKGVLAAVGAAAGLEFVAQGYPSNVQAWVTAKSNGLQPVYQHPGKGFGVRALGFGLVALALNFGDEGEYAPLVEAFAAIFLVTVVLLSGPQAYVNLGSMFGVTTPGAAAVTKDTGVSATTTAAQPASNPAQPTLFSGGEMTI